MFENLVAFWAFDKEKIGPCATRGTPTSTARTNKTHSSADTHGASVWVCSVPGGEGLETTTERCASNKTQNKSSSTTGAWAATKKNVWPMFLSSHLSSQRRPGLSGLVQVQIEEHDAQTVHR